MKKPSTELFELISTMTMNEKRYFKISASNHVKGEQNKYIVLFDFISEMKSYDEGKLKKKISKKFKAFNLKKEKHYLYEAIVKSLSDYSRQQPDKNEHYHDILAIKALNAKGLLSHSSKRIKKAQTKAIDKERHDLSFLFSDMEIENLRLLNYQGKSEKEIQWVFGQLYSELEKVKNLKKFEELSALLFRKIYMLGVMPDAQREKELKKIMSNKLFQHDSHCRTVEAHYHFLNCHFAYNISMLRFNKALSFSDKLIQLFDNNKIFRENNSVKYSSMLQNAAVAQLNNSNFDKADELLDKLKNIQSKSISFQNSCWFQSSFLKLSCCIRAGQFTNGVTVIGNIENWLSKVDYKPNQKQKISLHYSYGYIFLGASEYKKARKYFTIVAKTEHGEMRNDLFVFANFMNLIANYEMGDFEMLDYTLKSTKIAMGKRTHPMKIEQLLYDFFKETVSNELNKTEIKNQLLKLKEAVLHLEKDPEEKKGLASFDLISWIESRLTGKSFGDVIRNKIITYAA